MPRLRSTWFAAVGIALLSVSIAYAQEPIRFARTPDISPDGHWVAFSYLGDIWLVEAMGGIARPVTMHEAHDIFPVFSPDGKQIAFSSNRNGSYDVFVAPFLGGKPKRVTFDSATDVINGWSPDGKQLLFASTRSTAFPPGFGLYTVPVDGGRVRRITAGDGKEGVFSPEGKRIAYVRGAGTWYRKGYRGAANDDIWICNADGSSNQRLTTFNGQDGSPMWSRDGQFIYYVSECCAQTPPPPPPSPSPNSGEGKGRGGAPLQANIVRQDAAGKSKPTPITFHTEDSVRRARISADGNWIVYECGPDIWIVGTLENPKRPEDPTVTAPRKIGIEVHADDKANTERIRTFTSGASEFALSYDEKHVAFVVHGELFMMPITGGKPTRLTDDPAFDHEIAWSPDSKKIVFASDRSGQEDLYLLQPDDPEQKELVKAHKFKAVPLTDTPEPEYGVSFSPDGKRIAFIRAGKLWTMNPDPDPKKREEKVVVNDTEVFDYDWSPDGKWMVYARMDGSFASELYIIPSNPVPGGVSGKNITRYATYNAGVSWSQNGKKLAFIGQRRNHAGMYVLSLEKPAAPGVAETKTLHIDWDDIHLRVEQPALLPAEEGAISADGTKVAFRSAGPNGDDLWVAASNGGQLSRITNGNMRPQQIQWSRRVPDLVYFRDGGGSLHMVKLGLGMPSTIPFKVKMTIRRDEEFTEMFDQSWRALLEYFYDPKFHGADWSGVRKKYRPLVKHVALKEDLYALISLMMGELNASHMGIAGFVPPPEETTADLGLIFEESYPGPGLKIAEILKRGPADRRGINLKPGDIIGLIDGVQVTEKTSLAKLLNDKAGEAVVLKVSSNPAPDPRDPKAWRRVELQAASRQKISDLMYDRWVEGNARRVAELSKGKLGYIHIPSMDEAGMDKFLRALYSDSFDKDAIVLDVRYNGGGFTHDQVLNYLGGKEHTFFRQRHGGEGVVLRSYDRKWTRPMVLLINSRSYSDAEIFPSAFRTLGLGKLVGEPTGGHVIGTSAVRLIDGSFFRVPRTGVFTVKGINMERAGVTPDVVVEVHPDQIAKGEDPQLDKAVQVLQEEVVAWKKAQGGVAEKPSEPKPALTGVTPPPTMPPIGK